MRRQTFEPKWEDWKRTTKGHGLPRLIEQSTDGQNHPRPRKGFLLPMLSRIECDRKQGKYKLLEPSKGDRKSGAENTPNRMKPILSQKRVKPS